MQVARANHVDITDAYEASCIIMLNLNRSWIQKREISSSNRRSGVLLAAIIWFWLRRRKCCCFPHAIELLNCSTTEELFTPTDSSRGLENYLSPFVDAWKGGPQTIDGTDRLCEDSLSRYDLPQLYWVMSGDDFTLDINNPREPKILCVKTIPTGRTYTVRRSVLAI